MSELAFNINGEAFEVPANASGWRVRKMRAKGSPEVVYAREGQPLVLPISAEIADLRSEVDTTGRYRLDLVDQNNKPIEGAPSGYVQINFDAQSASPETTTSIAPPRASLTTPSEHIVLESMRMQSMIAVSVVERFPQVVEAVATLLRAADGAGLPARPGMALTATTEPDDEDDDQDEDEAPAAPAFDFNAMLAQMLPMLFSGFATGKLKMPDLGAVFDWRRATPKADATTKPAEAKPATPAAPAAEAKPAPLPPLDPAAMAHVIAIQAALEPNEVAYVKEVAKELSPAELRGWFDELSKLTVPQAVAKIRTLIAGNAEAVP